MEGRNPDLLPFRAEHSNFRGHHPNAKPPAHTVGWEWGSEGLFDESMNGNYVDGPVTSETCLTGAEGLRKTSSISLF